MSRYLLLDIGAGTLDILYVDTDSEQHYKAVVRSPVRTLAEKLEALEGPLLIDGGEMGGGPITTVVKQKARTTEVVMTEAAAATLHHHVDRVTQWGIRVVSQSQWSSLKAQGRHQHFTLGDLEIGRIRRIVLGFGVPFEIDVVAVCAQDHGVPPQGVSHLDYRHSLFRELLDKAPFPHSLLFHSERIPATFNRLNTIARDAKALKPKDIYVMDSGMAAVLGASMDPFCHGKERICVLDVATSHTVGAILEKGAVVGQFEYHTKDLSAQRLTSLITQLVEGELSHGDILAEGGHGAYLKKGVGFNRLQGIVATGPKRRLVAESPLPIYFGAPWGDNMMTGTVGLLEAVGRYTGATSLDYL